MRSDNMRYTVDIDRTIDSFTDCIKRVNEEINAWDWRISINAGGIDFGIYFNFDIKNKELEISNQPGYGYDNSLGLNEIIEKIRKSEEEDDN